VDPWDISWDEDQPSYRVHCRTRPAHSNAGPTCAEVEVTETDVADVLTWAHRTAASRRFVLYTVCDHTLRRGLVRLAGDEPTRGSGGWASTGEFTQPPI
jgi:hypothetical protein